MAKAPRSLRGERLLARVSTVEGAGASTLALVCVAATGGVADAQTQPSTLPTMVVDAPVVKRRPVAAPKPSAAQIRARTAVRQRARTAPVAAPTPASPSPAPVPIFARLPSDNPYAQAGSPYKANRVASKKFAEPIANTARTITVLTKEVLEDKGATSLRELGRSTAGVTLGTGEGGNAFGDRFFIRGFDTRNDVFLDGIRDPAVSVRENFFTEQVEILRGPASSFAGRGTAGGAINIVTKKASTDGSFRNIEVTGSPTDRGGRVTLDVNQAINSDLAVRVNGVFQDQKVPGRDFVTDNRAGAAVSVVYKPIEPLKISLDYIHTDLWGLPDFGVPYNRFGTNRPFTEGFTNRNLWYGFVNRDFQRVRQDIGTAGVEYQLNDHVTLSSRFRRQQSLLDYVGTLAEAPSFATTLPGGRVNLNPQSRYQQTAVIASQNDATIKFDIGPVLNTTVVGTEISHEQITRDSYRGLASEGFGAGAFNGNGGTVGGILFPPNLLPFSNKPSLAGNPTNIVVDSKSAYLIHSANYDDFIIVNGGLRVDDYRISSYAPTVAAAAVLNPGTPGLVNNFFNAYAGNHTTLFNYNAGLVVKPLPGWSLYAAYATSTNPFGSELDGTATDYGGVPPNATVILGPERNRAAEVGTKWELFDRHLLVTGALFHTEKDNARETVAGVLASGAAYQVEGIDLEVSGNITDRWGVFGGLVLMRSKVTQSALASNIGLQMANIAHESFSMLSKYKFDGGWELGGQAVYRSKIYGGTFGANTGTELPSYWRFDAFVEKKIDKNMSIKLYAQNLTNKLYYDTLYRNATPFVAVAPGRRRIHAITSSP